LTAQRKKQPFGTKAKQFASDLCFGQFVQVNHKNKFDRNKRLIAEIILLNGTNVNKELVNNGLLGISKNILTIKNMQN
jgi:micrococcal nuclease